MRKILTIITLISCLFITSCVIDETIEMKQTENEEVIKTKSVDYESPKLKFNIINKTENVTLYVEDSIVEFNDTILLNDIKLNEKKDTLILNGKLETEIFSIYEGLMYIPLNQHSTNNIILFNHCPWYDKEGCKILQLQTITFDVTISDWENDENIDI